MSVLIGPKLAFIDPFTATTAVAAPTVALTTLEDPPDPISMQVTLHARLIVGPPDDPPNF